MRRLIGVAVIVGTCAIASAAQAQRVTGAHPDANVPSPEPVNPPDGFQAALAKVGADLYIAGQPTADALRELRRKGVTTIVNLRTAPEMADVGFDEATLAGSLGMKYVNLPVRGTPDLPYSPATVDAFARALAEANGPVLLHCTVAWRASHLWAAYLIRERHMPEDSALAQARLINLMDMHHSGAGRQPVEDFLGRDLPALKKFRTP